MARERLHKGIQMLGLEHEPWTWKALVHIRNLYNRIVWGCVMRNVFQRSGLGRSRNNMVQWLFTGRENGIMFWANRRHW